MRFRGISFVAGSLMLLLVQPTRSMTKFVTVILESLRASEMEPVWDKIGSQKPLLPTKRKASTEPLSPSVLHHMEGHASSPRSSQHSAMNKRQTLLQSMPSKSGSQRVLTPKSRTAPQEVLPRVQSGSFEAVRSKMRDNLAVALSIGCRNKEKAHNEDDNSQSVPLVDAVEQTTGETCASKNIQISHEVGKKDGQEPQYNYVMPDADGSFGDAFFVKDELLQGNGLSWAWDMEVTDLKEVQIDEKSNSKRVEVGRNEDEQGESGDIPKLGRLIDDEKSSHELASRIEAELFNLFGGVNKKYKEKGRSLMFNLKDRNNPELREKVLSGAISPEQLCSMTPEELASKELSEWRMAKAEELDKMIVLQDSDVDIRRLVKKTHKGEYQVEVEQDYVSVEVSVGSSSFTQFQPKKKTHQVKEKEIADVNKSSSENRDPASSLTIPADGTDFMQELIVDEFKDEGVLPPVVSLDEFMESLNTEPPFENLPVDSIETKPVADNSNSETSGRTGSEKVPSEQASADPLGSKQPKAKTTEALLSMKTSESPIERKNMPASVAIGEHVWEGELQLTISSSISVFGLFRSGEKTSTKDWPGSMEIKGRVRLDAFEKFLQELPMSRTRAVMVVHFVLKDSSSDIHHAVLSEAVDSYIGDERLGFGEPNPGVELYFCPPHTRIIEMLSRHLSKDRTDILKSTDNGLIGVVVWRRPHISFTNSPTSSQHKHHKTQNFPTRRQENINGNINLKFSAKSLPVGNINCRLPQQPNDEDDDIPPGFGPGVAAASRDEDDLPEFNFSGNSNSSGQKILAQVGSVSRGPQSNPSRPVDQMRQLIYRYGQTAIGVDDTNQNSAGTGTKPWHQDDDDMPEWLPQLPQNHRHHRPEVLIHNMQQPLLPHMFNQFRPPIGQVVRPPMTIQPPVNVLQNVVRWPPPLSDPHVAPPNAAIPGQHYSGQWRLDAPRSRGF